MAVSAAAATSGAMSRVLKYAVMKPVSASTPSESSARKPCRPTRLPTNSDSDSITPAVPRMTISAPDPKLTSASSRPISPRYRRSVRGVHAIARA